MFVCLAGRVLLLCTGRPSCKRLMYAPFIAMGVGPASLKKGSVTTEAVTLMKPKLKDAAQHDKTELAQGTHRGGKCYVKLTLAIMIRDLIVFCGCVSVLYILGEQKSLKERSSPDSWTRPIFVVLDHIHLHVGEL